MRISHVLFGLVICLGLAACGGGGGDGPDGDCTTPPSGLVMTAAEAAMADQVLALVNQERGDRALGLVASHAGLRQVAFEHCWDMHTRAFFSHTNPCGEQPWDRVNRAGIAWVAIAENIASGSTTAASVMAGWMGSAGHRANILGSQYTHIGIAVYDSPSGFLWTMVLIDQ